MKYIRRQFSIFSSGRNLTNYYQSPSAARGLRYRKWPFAKEQCFGGFGGFPPHYRAYWTTGVERGGLGGILPPIIGRTWHPLRREGGFGGDPPPHSRAYLAPPAPRGGV